mmetsp:Transcript_4007/g.11944  ORF Transcript_4007/g.11944 Transcript_4007/m.11944 type:complete len:253 (-) Transcript_4007:117-875(-)
MAFTSTATRPRAPPRSSLGCKTPCSPPRGCWCLPCSLAPPSPPLPSYSPSPPPSSLLTVHLHLLPSQVLQYSAHKLREAAQGDRRSISLETKGSFEPEGAGDLSAALRKQLVSLITEGACRSAWEVERESEEGLVSSLTPPECTTEQDKVELAEEYRSVSTLSRFGTSQDVRGSRQTPVHVSTFAPRIFHELRRFGGVSTREYTHSLGGEATERFTEGKSGAFFYFTHDRRYIIKTASKEEFATLMRILPVT